MTRAGKSTTPNDAILAGFPREEFTALIRRLPAYARLAWALARDARLSRARRAAVLAGAAYVLSPVDLVPGFIPIAGQLDDVAVALGAIRLALNGLKPDARAEALAAANLSQTEMNADLRTTGAIAGWMARAGFRVTQRAGSTAVEIGIRVFRRARNAVS